MALTQIVGLHNAQGPPVPIPNTEVKLCGAENTRLEAVREDRARPTQYSSVAQSVERMTVNHDVTGSSPVRGARKKALVKASAVFSEIRLRRVKFGCAK